MRKKENIKMKLLCLFSLVIVISICFINSTNAETKDINKKLTIIEKVQSIKSDKAVPAIVTPSNPVTQSTASLNPAKVDTGDTTWVLISTALVMLMVPGLAFFYGGMVRRKNVLATVMQSFISLGVISLIWAFYGYSLAFGPDFHHIIGNLNWAWLNHVGISPNPNYAATIPHQTFMMFQMMFAIITPALITGAFAERFKFTTYLVFLVLWSTLVYSPLAHWVWGINGWLRNFGVLDFAGGMVVHISSAAAALAAVIIVGKRNKSSRDAFLPHNLNLTLIGTGLLWFGWFGFNAGSAVASGTLASSAFTATHLSAAAATFSWLIAEWLHRGKPTVLGAASGSIAGLASITPAAGFVGPMPAIIIGLVAGIICYLAITIKAKSGLDDTLDVIGVHGVGSSWGMLAVGLFASKAVNSLGNNGLFFGNASLLGTQAIGVLTVWIFSFVMTLIILKILDIIMGVRVSAEDEDEGLDLSQHGEKSYAF